MRLEEEDDECVQLPFVPASILWEYGPGPLLQPIQPPAGQRLDIAGKSTGVHATLADSTGMGAVVPAQAARRQPRRELHALARDGARSRRPLAQ